MKKYCIPLFSYTAAAETQLKCDGGIGTYTGQ